jgi:hypothetical protein
MQTNLYRALRDLLPEPTLQVATVTALNADGTTTVQYPGGGTQRVRGEATVATQVFVRAGVIEGEAPALTLVEIEI